jgi:transcription elongation factor SPT5
VLFDPDGVKEKYGDKSVERRNWVYIFRRDLYAYGFLEVETEDGYVPQDATPTCDELSLFEKHPRIPPSAIKKAYDITSSLVLQHGDRVLISTGEFQGLSGVIISVDASYANVDIPLRGMTTMIECNHLRKDIRVGDQVKVLTGPNTNFTGWVVSVEGGELVLYNREISNSNTISTQVRRTVPS